MPEAEAGPGLTTLNMRDDVVPVKSAFTYTPSCVAALEASLSAERLGTYLRKSKGNREQAIRLHIWNTAISAAFYGPLQCLEITLRNAMHARLSEAYGVTWYDDPSGILDHGTHTRIAGAREDLKRDGYPDDPPHVVAALPFGFWIMLLGAGGRMTAGGKANYEMTIWRKAGFRVFRHSRVTRKAAHKPLNYLRTLRNRIAHHEPIIDRHLAADYASIQQVMAWMAPDIGLWMDHHSRVAELLAFSPDSPDLTF